MDPILEMLSKSLLQKVTNVFQQCARELQSSGISVTWAYSSQNIPEVKLSWRGSDLIDRILHVYLLAGNSSATLELNIEIVAWRESIISELEGLRYRFSSIMGPFPLPINDKELRELLQTMFTQIRDVRATDLTLTPSAQV